MPRSIGTYDEKTYDLAESFLSDEPNLNTLDKIHHLAVHIQIVIEVWISTQNANGEPLDPMRGVEFPFAENH